MRCLFEFFLELTEDTLGWLGVEDELGLVGVIVAMLLVAIVATLMMELR